MLLVKQIKRVITGALAFSVVAGAGIIVSSSDASAQARRVLIKCPLVQAQRTITNRLPRGWWTTPIVSRLSGTRIMNIGGKPSLVCQYGASGSVQRLQPRGARCRTTPTGFFCRVSGRPGNPGGPGGRPQTFRTGGLVIPQTFLADLDSGRVRRGGADIWFQAKTQRAKFITPYGRAMISYAGGRQRGYRGCASARYTKRSLRLSPSMIGRYVCMKTDSGRISEFRINGMVGAWGGVQQLRLGFTTWR
ncbi:MAG: hypothetical protein MRY74_15965 [Neomegalonema sp.]|nr:hypothetical protein [Neomegalonema sp.]